MAVEKNALSFFYPNFFHGYQLPLNFVALEPLGTAMSKAEILPLYHLGAVNTNTQQVFIFIFTFIYFQIICKTDIVTPLHFAFRSNRITEFNFQCQKKLYITMFSWIW